MAEELWWPRRRCQRSLVMVNAVVDVEVPDRRRTGRDHRNYWSKFVGRAIVITNNQKGQITRKNCYHEQIFEWHKDFGL
jgi:hypothetical protein